MVEVLKLLRHLSMHLGSSAFRIAHANNVNEKLRNTLAWSSLSSIRSKSQQSPKRLHVISDGKNGRILETHNSVTGPEEGTLELTSQSSPWAPHLLVFPMDPFSTDGLFSCSWIELGMERIEE